MPSVISKPVQAMGTPSSSGGVVGVEQTDHSSLSHNENSYENETDLFLDPNPANIISSAVSNIKSNLYVNSKKKSGSHRVKDPCSVCSKMWLKTRNLFNVLTVNFGHMPPAMELANLSMQNLLLRVMKSLGSAYLVRS